VNVHQALASGLRSLSGDPLLRLLRHLDVALGRPHQAPNPGRSWLALEAVTLVREVLQGMRDGLARKPPAAGTLATGRAKDALAVLPKEA
jgi:hypothetical protein